MEQKFKSNPKNKKAGNAKLAKARLKRRNDVLWFGSEGVGTPNGTRVAIQHKEYKSRARQGYTKPVTWHAGPPMET